MLKLGLLLFAPALLFAWTAPLVTNTCNSAPRPAGVVFVNTDCANAPGLATSARLFFSLDNQASWAESTLRAVAAPAYESTFASGFAIPGSGSAHYYVRAENGTNYATQGPANSTNAWPPADNLLASTADERVGDAIEPEGGWLDLTGVWAGWSDDRFYASLRNDHTGWPLYSFPAPWYIYSLGLVNPDAPSDTFVFTMSYASIPGIFTTGLYAINRFTQTYERIGDVEAQTSGNRLYMRCPVATFVADPRFGPWPNSRNWLATAATTQAIYPIGGARLRDTAATCRWYVQTPRFDVGRNTAPLLLLGSVIPAQGTPETEFAFSVRHLDRDNNLPVLRALVVDAETLAPLPDSHAYSSGVTFSRTRRGFAPGWHRFRFAFDDGMGRVETPDDSFFVVGTGVEERPSAAVAGFRADPNPFRDRVAFGFSPAGPAAVRIYDVRGHLVRVLPVAPDAPAVWDGRDGAGRDAGRGVFYCRLDAGSFRAKRKLVRTD